MFGEKAGEPVARWMKGEQAVRYLIDRGRLESFEAADLGVVAEALTKRAALRVETTAVAALAGGDVYGAYVAAYDAYRMAAESLLARQGLPLPAVRGRMQPLKMLYRLSSPQASLRSRNPRSSDSGEPATRRSISIPRLRL
jgi:hypothetical protein